MRLLGFSLPFALCLVPCLLQAEPIQLTSNPGSDTHPSWTADGTAIVFESNRSGSWHLYRVPVSGGPVEQLTFTGDQRHPEVSPDGSRIVYLDGDATLAAASVQVMPIGGGSATTLLPGDSGKWAPTWSPDGQTIFVSRKPGTNWDLVSVPVTGGGFSAILDVNSTDIMGDVAPDGNHFVFYSNFGGGAFNVAASTLSNPQSYTRLTFDLYNTSQPVYSPDGTRIAFASRRVGNRLELFEMDLTTQMTRRLTFDAENSSFDPTNQLPAYSPDGTLLAFSSRRIYENDNIWLLSLTEAPSTGTTLRVGDGRGLQGPAVHVPVYLSSAVSAAALEFRLADVPDHLTVTGVEPAGRAAPMTASFVDNGGIHVLVYSPTGHVIPAGTGAILDLLVEVKQSADLGETIDLDLSDVVLADPSGSAVDADAVSGSFLVARLAGDLNGDNLVDVGDLVRLVEIILGTGHAPSAEEMDLADCNEDGSVNALDIVCLLDVILNAAPSLDATSPALAAAGTDFVIRAEDEVRGLQIMGTGLPGEDADLTPLTLHRLSGKAAAVAFDGGGGAWTEGTRVSLHTTGTPVDIRAYGPGGRRLAVTVDGNTITLGKPLAAGLRALPALPNPFRAATDIRFSMDAPGQVGITVFDLQGRKVSEVEPRVYEAGVHTVSWTARDLAGRRLPAGLYLARVQWGGRRASVRLVNLGG